VKEGFEAESEKRGLFIAQTLSRYAVTPLLYENMIELNERIRSTIQIDSTIMYVYVTDSENNVILHTFPNGFPRVLAEKLDLLSEAADFRFFSLAGDDLELIREIQAPILNGRLGRMHVGIREIELSRGIRGIVGRFFAMVLVFLVLGLIGAIVFSRIITTPIHTIAEVANGMTLSALQNGNLARVKLFGIFPKMNGAGRIEDELDGLARQFNAMIDRLELAYKDLQTTQKVLIRSDKLATVGTFASGIAHEINNPLAGLQNCLERIKRNPDNLAQNQQYLTMMSGAMKKIETVVQGLLQYVRQEEDHHDAVQCTEVLEQAVTLVSYNHEHLSLDVKLDFLTDHCLIKGNSGQLQQVFVNLIINAVHAVEERRLREPDCDARITISGKRDGAFVMVKVADTGIGISSDIIESIFDPFYTTKEVGRGTGLGLSICQKIIELHHGTISVASIRGRGTEMHVRIPVWEGEYTSVRPIAQENYKGIV